MSFYNERTVTTRKPHICEWCGKQISTGSSAKYVSGVFEGDFFNYYAHPECDKLIYKLNMDEYNEGMDRTTWQDCVYNEYCDIVKHNGGPTPPFSEVLRIVLEKYQ